jgi:hypothetical protein
LFGYGQTAIKLAPGTAQVRIFGSHFDGTGYGVQSSADAVKIIGNDFEASHSTQQDPSIQIVTAGSNQGRAHVIMGNNFTAGYFYVNATCTASSGSATLTSCSPTTGLYGGMAACGANLPAAYKYGANPPGTSSTSTVNLGGALFISSISGSSVTLTGNASASGTFPVTFMNPVYSWPVSPTYPVVSMGNTFDGWSGCPGGHDGG